MLVSIVFLLLVKRNALIDQFFLLIKLIFGVPLQFSTGWGQSRAKGGKDLDW